MRLKEVAEDMEKRRIETLKNNAERAKKVVKDAQARYKMKRAQEQLLKLKSSTSNPSLTG